MRRSLRPFKLLFEDIALKFGTKSENLMSEIEPSGVMAEIAKAIEAKNAGTFAEADSILATALVTSPRNKDLYYELGVVNLLWGRHEQAVVYFQGALSADGDHHLAAHQLAIAAAMLGSRSLLREATGFLKINPADIKIAKEALQLLEFVEAYPLADVLRQLRLIEGEATTLGCDGLIDAIISAAQRGTPFSFVRLGDGEGTRIKFNSFDEAKYSAIYDYSRDKFLDIWYKGVVSDPAAFDQLSYGLNDVIRTADIIGIPYEPWLRHEYTIASISGITSLVNIVRALGDLPRPIHFKVCWQNIHFALGQSNFFERLFRIDSKFALISCHEGLGAALEERFRVGNVEVIKIPGEGAYRSLIGDQHDVRLHFPDVFNEVKAAIEGRDLIGHIFLVSAGFLGKFYCAYIKDRGGIAIDTGSIVDGWMGVNTRPGMETIAAL
jgi:hypothetical protein